MYSHWRRYGVDNLALLSPLGTWACIAIIGLWMLGLYLLATVRIRR